MPARVLHRGRRAILLAGAGGLGAVLGFLAGLRALLDRDGGLESFRLEVGAMIAIVSFAGMMVLGALRMRRDRAVTA